MKRWREHNQRDWLRIHYFWQNINSTGIHCGSCLCQQSERFTFDVAVIFRTIRGGALGGDEGRREGGREIKRGWKKRQRVTERGEIKGQQMTNKEREISRWKEKWKREERVKKMKWRREVWRDLGPVKVLGSEKCSYKRAGLNFTRAVFGNRKLLLAARLQKDFLNYFVIRLPLWKVYAKRSKRKRREVAIAS